MPHLHRNRAATHEGTPPPAPTDPDIAPAAAEPEPVDGLDGIVVDEHGDDAAAVAAPPARRRR